MSCYITSFSIEFLCDFLGKTALFYQVMASWRATSVVSFDCSSSDCRSMHLMEVHQLWECLNLQHLQHCQLLSANTIALIQNKETELLPAFQSSLQHNKHGMARLENHLKEIIPVDITIAFIENVILLRKAQIRSFNCQRL